MIDAATRSGRRPVASVVIPTHNTSDLLANCLAALRRQTFRSFETIVVDNHSTDDSRVLLASGHPDVQVVELPENRGFAAAANAGISVARGRYVCLLNSDTVPDPGWLQELLTCLARHPNASSADARIARASDPAILDGAGDMMTWSLKAYRRGYGATDSAEYDLECEVFSAAGTACAWRADILRRLGGFDEDMFAYYEDVELGFRARLAGFECWYAPLARVAHVGGATSARDRMSFDYFHSTRNRYLMRIKNAPSWWLASRAPAIAAGELLAFGRASVGGGLRHYLRAHVSVITSMPAWLDKRRHVSTHGSSRSSFRTIVGRALPPLYVSTPRRTSFERRLAAAAPRIGRRRTGGATR